MASFSGPNVVNSAELRDLLIADIVLTLAFALAISGGSAALSRSAIPFLYSLPIAFVAVSLTFVLHELMHKFVAQYYGAIAAFRTSTNGLLITIVTSFLGFLVGIPGATVIYTNTFTKRQDGIVSIAGPLANFAIFAIFFSIGYFLFPNYIHGFGISLSNTYLQNILYFVPFISIWLAFFNMMPIYPLDGSKVLHWNKGVYVVTLGAIFVIFFSLYSAIISIFSLVTLLIFALIVSSVFRMITI